MNYISTAPLYDGNYLAHYGIKGQKWGIRRFQNSDGSLTAEGRKRYGSVENLKKQFKKDYKLDQKNAYQLGRRATIDAQAAEYARARMNKASEKLKKKEAKDSKNTDKEYHELAEAYDRFTKLNNKAYSSEKLMKEHYNELVKRYGKTAIKDLSRDEQGNPNERVQSGAKALANMLAISGGVAVASAFAPPGAQYGLVLSGALTSNYVNASAAKRLGKKAYKQFVRDEEKERKERAKRNSAQRPTSFSVTGYN